MTRHIPNNLRSEDLSYIKFKNASPKRRNSILKRPSPWIILLYTNNHLTANYRFL